MATRTPVCRAPLPHPRTQRGPDQHQHATIGRLGGGNLERLHRRAASKGVAEAGIEGWRHPVHVDWLSKTLPAYGKSVPHGTLSYYFIVDDLVWISTRTVCRADD